MDAYTGEIRIFAGKFAPVNWHMCDGTALAITAYEPLYALLGITYGGDGRTTFALPDLRGRLGVGVGRYIEGATSTNYVLGQKGGRERWAECGEHGSALPYAQYRRSG